MSWELRVVRGSAGNAFSLPDGAVYVDRGMLQLLRNDAGLWAAVLSHEMAHITQHHWTKLADFQDSLGNPGSSYFTLLSGFPSMVIPSTERDRERQLTAFSRELELQADVAALDLMARTGFHPDFLIALYHLLEAQEGSNNSAHFLGSHPGWDVRESNLRKKSSTAVSKFVKLWPNSANSPGGSPPTLAFIGPPVVHESRQTSVSLPLRCKNSSGALEIELLFRRSRSSSRPFTGQIQKMQQAISCTSDRTMVTFPIEAAHPSEEADVEFYVMDSRGWVLARSSRVPVRY